MKSFTYFLAALIGFSLSVNFVGDTDLGWQLLGGAWIAETGKLPDHDFINTFTLEWHNYHWLGQLALYAVYSYGGHPLLRALAGVLGALLAVLVVDTCRLTRRDKTVSALDLLVLVGLGALAVHSQSIRPQFFSIIAIALSVRILVRPSKFELVYLFLLAVFAVNIHVYWILIPLLWGALRCLPRFFRTRAPTPYYAWGGLIILSLAGFVSPYGFDNYGLIWEYLNLQPYVKKNIYEFGSPFGTFGIIQVILLLYFALFVRGVKLKHLLAREGLAILAIVGLALGLKVNRFVPILAIFAGPWLLCEAARLRRTLTWPKSPHLATFSTVGGTLLAIWLAFSIATEGPWAKSKLETTDEYYPLTACSKIPELGLKPSEGRDHLRVLTHFNHGGWCRWAAYQTDPNWPVQVTTDSRTQRVPNAHYLHYSSIYYLREGWLNNLQSWNPDLVLVARDHPLGHVLPYLGNQWQQVYADRRFALYKPVR